MKTKVYLSVVLLVAAVAVGLAQTPAGRGQGRGQAAPEADSVFNPNANPKYVVTETWAQLPAGTKEWGPISALSLDAKGNLHVLRRTFPSMFAFTPDGKFMKSWGAEGFLTGPGAHGIRFSSDGSLWLTDTNAHMVYKVNPADGKVLMQFGTKGVIGDNASKVGFNRPADVFVAPSGDIYIADGYGNSRVIVFSKDGMFKQIIGGTLGTEPGQFRTVHSVAMDTKGRLLIGDRENGRVQVYGQDGKLIEIWSNLGKPYGQFLAPDDTLYVGDAAANTITISKDGKLIDKLVELGRPHSVSVAANGVIYMADVRGFVRRISKK